MTRRPLLAPLLLISIFAFALGLRLYDLTDPPFDFHPTRQWRSAIIARGMYYAALESAPAWQREAAAAQWQREEVIEPPIMEAIVALGYRLLGGEKLWLARLLSAVFWTAGGAAVFALGRDLSAARGAALGGLAAALYYLFLPYGVYASRSFQPDPLMTALIAAALWAAYRFHQGPTYRAAALAGGLIGLAVLVKTVAGFMLGGALGFLLINRAWRIEDRRSKIEDRRSQMGDRFSIFDLRSLIFDRKIWLLAGFAALPTALYYVYGVWIAGFLGQQFKFRFFPALLAAPEFYIRWVETATDIAGFGAILAALIGIFLIRERGGRSLMLGAWLGYAAYSLTFAYHTLTHDYYQLPLIPIVAASLAPAAGRVLRGVFAPPASPPEGESALRRNLFPAGWLPRLAAAGVILFAILFKSWDVRVTLARKDYRPEAAFWAEVGRVIGPEKQVIALTQAYGYPLAYYGWVSADLWLSESDAVLRNLAGIDSNAVEGKRQGALEGKDLFLVTNFSELDRQPGLKEMLYNGYDIKAEGPGFVIFDLRKPK